MLKMKVRKNIFVVCFLVLMMLSVLIILQTYRHSSGESTWIKKIKVYSSLPTKYMRYFPESANDIVLQSIHNDAWVSGNFRVNKKLLFEWAEVNGVNLVASNFIEIFYFNKKIDKIHFEKKEVKKAYYATGKSGGGIWTYSYDAYNERVYFARSKW